MVTDWASTIASALYLAVYLVLLPRLGCTRHTRQTHLWPRGNSHTAQGT